MNFNRRVLLGKFIDQPCHAVDTRVAAAHHRHVFSLDRFFDCHAAAVHLLLHRGGQKGFVGKPLANQIHIDGVACDDIALFDGVDGSRCDLVQTAGTQSHNKQFHSISSFLYGCYPLKDKCPV